MCGRNEKDIQMEKKIKRHVSGCNELIKKYISSRKKMTTYTRYVYSTYLVSFYEYIIKNGIDILNVKPMDIDDYIEYISKDKNGNNNGPQIINARLSAIISFYDYLVENKLISENPCNNNKKLKVPKTQTVTYLTPEEVKMIKAVIKKGNGRYKKYINRDIAILEVGCSMGLRVSALINIDMEDIDFENNKIKVIEKGKTEREVYFGDNTKKSLLSWICDRNKIMDNNKGALFISKNKTRMTRDAVSDMLKNATKAAGINKHITPHKMRTTFGMNTYGATKDIRLTQNLMGHANIENTLIYVKATEEQKKNAVNIVDSLY